MSGSNGDARPTAAANPEGVDLYRLLHEAGRPLSLKEIAERMPSAYRSHAYRQLRTHLITQDVPVKDGNWSTAEKDAAWLWWLRQVIETNRKARRVRPTFPDGSLVPGGGRPKDEILYVANPDKPPVVMVQEMVQVARYWTPDIAAAGQRHAAGMAFLKMLDDGVLAKVKLPAEVREALDLAEASIRRTT